MKIFKNNKKFIYVGMIIIFLIGLISIIFISKNEDNKIEMADFVYAENNIDMNQEKDNELVKNENTKSETTNQEIYVHIIGEVKNEGIVILKKGERVVDAIEKAGGVTEKADLSKVNLAYKLSDGQKIKIPNIDENEVKENSSINNFSEFQNEISNKVNINTASQTELETLTGIGPSLASKIIDYRKKNGDFKKIEEIQNVNGIGAEKYDGIKEEIDV